MKRIVMIAVLLGLAGCAASTKPVHLEFPATDRVDGDLRPIVLSHVIDNRNLDSLVSYDVRSLPSKQLQTVVFGLPHASWVYVSDNGKTIAEEVRRLVEIDLKNHGYKIVPASDAAPDVPQLSIKVNQFFGTLPFNFGRALTWTKQMKVWIDTDIEIKSNGLSRGFSVRGYGENIVQLLRDYNVTQTYSMAFDDYLKSFDEKVYLSL